jgi:hypothetical protein
MWRRIEVRNYRSIEHVSVDLAPFTVVVGPNGSGKSNFADAFVFARDIANDASTAVQNRGGIAGVRRWRPSRPADVTIDVRAAATQADLDTDYARHSFTLASKREGQWEFKRELIIWADSVASTQGRPTPTAAVMGVREFEAWLLWGHSDAELAKVKASDPDRIRNAKGKLEKLVSGYEPTTHQLEQTRQIDIQRLRKRSRSFDKLVRTLGGLCEIPVPHRPS